MPQVRTDRLTKQPHSVKFTSIDFKSMRNLKENLETMELPLVRRKFTTLSEFEAEIRISWLTRSIKSCVQAMTVTPLGIVYRTHSIGTNPLLSAEVKARVWLFCFCSARQTAWTCNSKVSTDFLHTVQKKASNAYLVIWFMFQTATI